MSLARTSEGAIVIEEEMWSSSPRRGGLVQQESVARNSDDEECRRDQTRIKRGSMRSSGCVVGFYEGMRCR